MILPFYYETADTECITVGEFLPEGKKFRKKELGLFARNEERTSGDGRFSDFTLEYQVDWIKTKSEVDKHMKKGVFDEWISKQKNAFYFLRLHIRTCHFFFTFFHHQNTVCKAVYILEGHQARRF